MRILTGSTRVDVTVTVRLYATFRQFVPEGADRRGFPVTLPKDATLGTLVERLGMPGGQRRLAFRNAVHCDDADPLRDGDLVVLFPPIAGG